MQIDLSGLKCIIVVKNYFISYLLISGIICNKSFINFFISDRRSSTTFGFKLESGFFHIAIIIIDIGRVAELNIGTADHLRLVINSVVICTIHIAEIKLHVFTLRFGVLCDLSLW